MSEAKIQSREALIPLVSELKASGVAVGFTSGVFDIIHPGHVQYLEDARAQCDVLIVGVNADVSVRQNKGLLRPIVSEMSRARVVAGLASVNYVFIFEELNNNANIEALKPSIYLKAGDYAKDQLTSAPLVEAYGGKVTLVPMVDGYSSSSIVNKIASQYGESHGAPYPVFHDPRPALFVDRDGTIIEHVEYLHEPSKISFIPGALEALKAAQEKGYRIIIVTNQPGIGLGYFTKEDLFAVNREILKAAGKVGLGIDKIYYCPHSKSDGCPCRKPGTELVERAVAELQIDVPKSFVIGDMTSDLELGRRSGAKAVLVKTGRGGDDGMFGVTPDLVIESLATIADVIPDAHGGAVTRVRSELPLESLEAIGQVAGKIGHDFNNLLSSIVGGIDLIMSKSAKLHVDTNPFEKPLSLMSVASQKAVELTTRIRGYLRDGPMELDAVSLASTIEEAKNYGVRLFADGVTWKIECSPEFTVRANSFFLTRVLYSLLENSYQSYPKQGEKKIQVHVRHLPKKNAYEIEVKDWGRGMSPEEVHGAFIPLRAKKEGVGSGFGLSLPMAKALLGRMGGGIAVTSVKGEGTSAVVWLPQS